MPIESVNRAGFSEVFDRIRFGFGGYSGLLKIGVRVKTSFSGLDNELSIQLQRVKGSVRTAKIYDAVFNGGTGKY